MINLHQLPFLPTYFSHTILRYTVAFHSWLSFESKLGKGEHEFKNIKPLKPTLVSWQLRLGLLVRHIPVNIRTRTIALNLSLLLSQSMQAILCSSTNICILSEESICCTGMVEHFAYFLHTFGWLDVFVCSTDLSGASEREDHHKLLSLALLCCLSFLIKHFIIAREVPEYWTVFQNCTFFQLEQEPQTHTVTFSN